MPKIFMIPPHDLGRVVPVDEFWVEYRTKLGWKRVTPSQAEKITEQGQAPVKESTNG